MNHRMNHRIKWIWVDILNGIFVILLSAYHVPWYIIIPGVAIVACCNYADGLFKD
jgi:uncharacterized membrane protein